MEDEASPSPRSKPRYTGQVRLCTARYSYNPYDGPNEHPEAELPLVAGKYLYVYGDMDDDGFYEGELLDGQRGLVPSNFVEFVQQDKEKQPHIQSGEGGQSLAPLSLPAPDGGGEGGGGGAPSSQDLLLSSSDALLPCSNGTNEQLDPEDLAEDAVPFPRKVALIKQLARSVIVAWEPPLVPPGWAGGAISGYEVLVDGERRATVPFGGRTNCLLEKLDLDSGVHRVSVRALSERGVSDELRCTVLVGAGAVVAPCGLRVDNIRRDTAELSWLPSNSNYAHAVFLDGVEVALVRPGRRHLHLARLAPLTVYKVTVAARPHQVPWQLPLEQRERKEAAVEFCTLAAGPPLPPQDVQVLCGPAPGVLQVHWTPPSLSPTGTSNGANVVGYAVCTKGQRVAEVLYPMANFVSVDVNRIQCLEAREVIVRTLSVQGESQDSTVALIPNNLLLGPPPLALPAPVRPHPPRGPPHLPHPQPHPRMPHPPGLQPRPLGPRPLPAPPRPEAKEHGGVAPPPPAGWDPSRCPSPRPPLPPLHGHALEAPLPVNPRLPSPQRILPQPRGTLIPDTVAKAIAREAAQRVAAQSGKGERVAPPPQQQRPRTFQSDDEDEDEDGTRRGRRRGPSVDDFLRGSELGRQPHCGQGDDYHSESSRGSDLSDILEEDEEELHSEMQLDEGRRRSSHNTAKTNSGSGGRDPGRRTHHHGGPQPQRAPPLAVPSIEVTSEGSPSPSASRGTWSPRRRRRRPRSAGAGSPHDGYRDRRHSPTYYEDSEGEEPFRVFVALFDYDPLSMSPNPDGADEELPFKEGQIIKVYGDKDTDGFYRGYLRGRRGLLPCNMVSEIRAEDEETLEQLLQQGFLPLSTPVDRIEQSRRGLRRDQASRRMVALYDYDPRESSPNVDVEAELTFCAGDIIAVYGDIDEDGFYYGEMNGQRGLVPSNFLEEVPDDVEVYLTDTPSRHQQGAPVERGATTAAATVATTAAASEVKRVSPEDNDKVDDNVPSTRAPSPILQPLLPGTMRPISPAQGRTQSHTPLALHDHQDSNKKRKGLLSKGKKLLKRLSPVK